MKIGVDWKQPGAGRRRAIEEMASGYTRRKSNVSDPKCWVKKRY